MQTHILPGQIWRDTNGERIQAHGASVFYENGKYYWYGEDKSHTRKKGNRTSALNRRMTGCDAWPVYLIDRTTQGALIHE